MTTLNGTVSLKEVDSVTVSIGKKLDLDVSGFVEESWHQLGLAHDSRSMNTVPSPKALLASLTARSKFSLKLS